MEISRITFKLLVYLAARDFSFKIVLKQFLTSNVIYYTNVVNDSRDFFLIFTARNEVCEGYVFTRVCHSVHRGWYPSMPCSGGWLSQHALQVVSQHPLQQGGLQAHTHGGSPGMDPGPHPGGAPGPHPGKGSPGPHLGEGCIPACTEADLPPPHGRLLPRVVRILLECILVVH